MDTSDPLVTSESVLLQVIHSNPLNNIAHCNTLTSLELGKNSSLLDHIVSSCGNFTQLMWEKVKLSNANVSPHEMSYAINGAWNSLTNEEKDLFENNKVPTDETLNGFAKQISLLINNQQTRQGPSNTKFNLDNASVGYNAEAETIATASEADKPSECKSDFSTLMLNAVPAFSCQVGAQDASAKFSFKNESSFGNILQPDASSWHEGEGHDGSLEPGECANKLDNSEMTQNILNLDHIEGQLLLGIGMPEWSELVQKDDEGRLLEMNFINCDAEKRMLRATLIERSKEINRLQKELSTVFQIIHQLKQENEYLTQQQHFTQLQQQSTLQQPSVQHPMLQQDNNVAGQQSAIHVIAQDALSATVSLTSSEQQEFLSLQTSACESSQQNDQLLLLELLNHMPPPTSEMQ